MQSRSFDPREAVESMSWAFLTRTTGLFDSTRPPEYRDHQKGLYGILYVSPTKAVSRLLAVDREILALVTSYSDLQQRTIQFAIDIILDSNGRLENTVAIVVHRDSLGNGKLKDWGRELGLTVIPLFMSSYDLPTGKDLERLLLAEFFSHDPFEVTGPVSDDNQFYGRRDETQDLARQLQTGQVRACLGIRKTGKTSVVHRLLSLVRSYHASYSVVGDCSIDAVSSMRAPQLLAAIAEAAKRALASSEYYASIASEKGDVSLEDANARLVAALQSAPGPMILILDEVDYITPASPTARHWEREFNTFWRHLRSTFQELARTGPPFSVLVSGVSSKWFRVESIEGIENAALSFIPEQYLAPLSAPASIAMVKSIGRTSGLIFDDEAAGVLAASCSHIPFWIRKAGSYVHRHTEIETRPTNVAADRVSALFHSFVQTEGAAVAEAALGHLFRVYPELAPVAESCTRPQSGLALPHLVGVLLQYGVLRSEGGVVTVSGPMMDAGLSLSLENLSSASGTGRTTKGGNLRFETTDEWGDELGLVNARRNKLEKRLRSVAVAFIRVDALTNKSKGTVLDRVLRVIDEERRLHLRSLGPDDAVEKFNWSDLVHIIEKEWSLFQPVFNDKSAFTLNGAILNGRPDAHAKDADVADLALYRRALEWMEAGLARVL